MHVDNTKFPILEVSFACCPPVVEHRKPYAKLAVSFLKYVKLKKTSTLIAWKLIIPYTIHMEWLFLPT